MQWLRLTTKMAHLFKTLSVLVRSRVVETWNVLRTWKKIQWLTDIIDEQELGREK